MVDFYIEIVIYENDKTLTTFLNGVDMILRVHILGETL